MPLNRFERYLYRFRIFVFLLKDGKFHVRIASMFLINELETRLDGKRDKVCFWTVEAYFQSAAMTG